VAIEHGAQRIDAGQDEPQPIRAGWFLGDRGDNGRLSRQHGQRDIQRGG
jgi:hypothetical protein